MMMGMRRVWRPGKHVTIDKSMIAYMGRAVTFVQYIPSKAIRHGIQVYTLCCAVLAILLAYQVYTAKEDERDNLATEICYRLCRSGCITKERGHVIYKENWYMGTKLHKKIEQYK